MKEKLNLERPITFNQKLQWLKLHNTDERYTRMVDKYEVRKIIEQEIGQEYLIPLIGVWDKFDDIDFKTLPNQFVLKPNHISGSVVICKGKETFNVRQARKTLNKALRRNYFYSGREKPYRNVRARIIAEKYMVDESGKELKDYKFFCFNGVPTLLFIATGRNIGNTKFDFYDLNFNHLPIKNGHENSNIPLAKPNNFDQMVDLAARLSKGIPHLRVDLYNVGGKIYFGEFTFHHWGGITRFEPEEWDYKLGQLINLEYI
jgi:hypothetical protein